MSLDLLMYALAGGAVGILAARAVSHLKEIEHVHFIDPVRWQIDLEHFGYELKETSKCVICGVMVTDENIGMLAFSEPDPIEVCQKIRCMTTVQRQLHLIDMESDAAA